MQTAAPHGLPAHFFPILNVFPAFVYSSAASSVLDEPLKTNSQVQHQVETETMYYDFVSTCNQNYKNKLPLTKFVK